MSASAGRRPKPAASPTPVDAALELLSSIALDPELDGLREASIAGDRPPAFHGDEIDPYVAEIGRRHCEEIAARRVRAWFAVGITDGRDA